MIDHPDQALIQCFRRYRLRHKHVHTGIPRFTDPLAIAVAGQHNHRYVGIRTFGVVSQEFYELQPVGRFHMPVCNDQVDGVAAQNHTRQIDIVGLRELYDAEPAANILDDGAHELVVVHGKHAERLEFRSR